MPRLNGKHKRFIIKQLACYAQVRDVANAFEDEFGIGIDKPQICYYNPNTKHGRRELAPKWKDLFAETRKNYLENVAQRPLAHPGYRLEILQKALKLAIDNEDPDQLRKIAETAAKEVGGKFNEDDLSRMLHPASEVNVFTQINQKIYNIADTSDSLPDGKEVLQAGKEGV